MRRTMTGTIMVIMVVAAGWTAAWAAPAGDGADTGGEGDLVKATLLADVDGITPGTTFMLGVKLTMKPHWHTYWINPGESGQATTIKLQGPQGLEFGPVQWPLPTRIDLDGGVCYGYENEVLLMVPVKFTGKPSPASLGIDAEVTWLVCKETCIEGGAKLSITLPVSEASKPANAELFSGWRARLPKAADQVTAGEARCKIDQPKDGNGEALPALTIQWKQAPKKVEFFPVSTRAVAIDDVAIKSSSTGTSTIISFKPQVFDAKVLAELKGQVDGVVVFTDDKGRREGVAVGFVVPVK